MFLGTTEYTNMETLDAIVNESKKTKRTIVEVKSQRLLKDNKVGRNTKST